MLYRKLYFRSKKRTLFMLYTISPVRQRKICLVSMVYFFSSSKICTVLMIACAAPSIPSTPLSTLRL